MRKTRYATHRRPYRQSRYKGIAPNEVRIPIAPQGDPEKNPLVIPDEERTEGDLWGKYAGSQAYRDALEGTVKFGVGDIVEKLRDIFDYNRRLDKKVDAELANGMQITIDALSSLDIASRFLGKAYAYYAEFIDWMDAYEQAMPLIWESIPNLKGTVDSIKNKSKPIGPQKGVENALDNVVADLQQTYDAFKEEMKYEPEE